MGGSSGGGGGDTKNEFVPPKYVKPYSKEMLGMASNYANSPFQSYGGDRVAGFTPFQQQGFNMVGQQAGWGQGMTGQGLGQLSSTLGGDYLNGNPYTDQIIGRTLGDMADQYRYATGPGNAAMASMSGSFDNSGVAGKDMMDRFSLARAMGDAASGIRYDNYAQERQNQLGAVNPALGFGQQSLGSLQQAGGQQQALGQANLDTQFQDFMRSIQDPVDKLRALTGTVGTAQGNYGISSGQSQSNVPNWAIGSTIGGSILGK
jgi:hypothetical protein